MVICQGTNKNLFEIAGFETTGQILLGETVNAEGMDLFVLAKCLRKKDLHRKL